MDDRHEGICIRSSRKLVSPFWNLSFATRIWIDWKTQENAATFSHNKEFLLVTEHKGICSLLSKKAHPIRETCQMNFMLLFNTDKWEHGG